MRIALAVLAAAAVIAGVVVAVSGQADKGHARVGVRAPARVGATAGATVTERARAEVGRHRPVVGLGGALIPAARYLGMSRAELLRGVRAGQTLAMITARRKGRSVSGLIDALVAARGARIAAAVRLGALSPTEASELKATLRRRMRALVERGTTRSG
jgi:hypothetical protein